MGSPNDPLLEEVMKKCPSNLREQLEVELIMRRNRMHDSGQKKFAITMQNIEFALGAMFSYNLQAKKLIEVVPPEGVTVVVSGVKYNIKEGKGGIIVTKEGGGELSIQPKSDTRVVLI